MASPSGTSVGAELAYDRLRSAIVENRYEPGERLVEQRVAQELSLSRTPVREAIRRLEAEGLVVTQRHRGAVVRSLTIAEVIDLYGLRERLEAYAAELAAVRITPAEVGQLRAAADRFGDAVSSWTDGDLDDVRRVNHANRELHDLVLSAARHDRLRAMLHRTVDIPLVFRAFTTFTRPELERSDMFHRLIVDAIERGDAERVGRLMAEHIAQGCDAVVRAAAGHNASVGDA